MVQDENALTTYIGNMLRWARFMRIFDPALGNWYGIMIQVWSSMSVEIIQYPRQPTPPEDLESYMMMVEQTKTTLLAAGRAKRSQRGVTATPASTFRPDRLPFSSSHRPEKSSQGSHKTEQQNTSYRPSYQRDFPSTCRGDRRSEGRRFDDRGIKDRRQDDRRQD